MRTIQLVEKSSGRIRKNESYKIPELLNLVMPKFVWKLFSVDKKIEALIDSDKEGRN